MGKVGKIVSLLTLTTAGFGLLTGGTFALFTASTSNAANTFTAGTLKVDDVTGQGVFTKTLYFSNLAPGDVEDTYVSVKNTGSLDEWVYLDAPATYASETGSLFQGGGRLTLFCDRPAIFLASGQTGNLPLTYSLPIGADNSYQHATGSVTIRVNAVQARNNTPPALQVPLAGYLNNEGTGTDPGVQGSFGGSGESYVPNTLPTGSITAMVNTQPVTFAAIPPSGLNNMYVNNQVMNINAQTGFNKLYVLTSTDWCTGSSRTANVLVEYTDGTSANVSFSVGDWVVPPSSLPANETIAWSYPNWYINGVASQGYNGPHIWTASGQLDPAKQVKTLTFTGDSYVHIWGVTLQ